MTCKNSSQNINKTFIIEPTPFSASTVISPCGGVNTNEINSCSGDTRIDLAQGEIRINNDLIPDNPSVSVGSETKRFRELNAISGSVSVWSATTRTHTPALHLGQDSSGNTRTITADNSIIQNDILIGGTF